MRRFSIFILLIGGLIQISFSQSEFLQRDQSGFGGGIMLITNRNASGFGLNAGYSYCGFLDGSLSFKKSDAGDAKEGIISPQITFYPVKQEDAENAPTLGISASYSHFSRTEINTFDVPDSPATHHSVQQVEEKKINEITLGVTAHRRMGYWEILFFQPMFGAGLSMTNSGWQFALRGGVAIGTRVVNGPLLFLMPMIERQAGLTTLTFALGAVF